jgi:hypothetical protein
MSIISGNKGQGRNIGTIFIFNLSGDGLSPSLVHINLFFKDLMVVIIVSKYLITVIVRVQWL